ncbi:serine/threonine protein kinase [Salpingoeca rosetta]|uniref:Serine/threonine protein kinase n=1 Tax=Salpingoeca rosetta (strain ATCC 50818 / BSB-021) TaxID=946362 RepID=F2UIL8_SALR5|nr:serine/threonine protein kinase [Salpingoeca rosetta]EGD77067.1 serine/threonine protein kinase [Salpingoeca rosetta]|eukprot:XP_004990907.1 serine/threonine protein kinase [Salpingoeca rosetta]
MDEKQTLTARLRRRLTRDDEAEERHVLRVRIKQQDEVPKHVTLNDKLGEGTFATVFTGVTMMQPSETRAIKVIDRRTSNWKLLEAECAVLERVKHDHIIGLFMILEAPKYLYLVLEWCRYGDLDTKVRQMPENRLPDRTAAHITLQLADALAYLHHNVVEEAACCVLRLVALL